MPRLTEKTPYGYRLIGTEGLLPDNCYVQGKYREAVNKLGELEDAAEAAMEGGKTNA